MQFAVTKLCDRVNMSSQNFYKARKVRAKTQVNEAKIKELVKIERKTEPRIGGLKLHYELAAALKAEGISIGRDKFFKVLQNQGLLLERLPKKPRTTNSKHSLPVFTNLIKNMDLTGANQVWVSDITYIRLNAGFLYLSLITDKFSRKIVGYYLGESLKADDTLKALNMALAGLPKGVYPIHHSDRGIQYCSHKYVERLNEYGLSISMTEVDHCAENALAERVNGIIKQEYFLSDQFKTLEHAHKAVNEGVFLYNTRRLHRSLNMRRPSDVHADIA